MVPSAAVTGKRPQPHRYELLYDAVAFGMWAYTNATFRVATLCGERLRWRRGLLIVCSHRAETDVPLLCPSLYLRADFVRERRHRLHFAARDDVFDKGFFAGFPPHLPIRLRRLLYPLGVGRLLQNMPMHPVPYPGVGQLRLGRALAELPAETVLAPILPESVIHRLEVRAREAHLRPPRTARDALRGAYADLLWEFCKCEELADPAFQGAWRHRMEEGATALRSLIELIRSGESLLLFPEGRPSPDGAIGPLRPGVTKLIRYGRPEALQPLAVCYDPLTTRRTRAYVAFGEEIPLLVDDLDQAILRGLRHTTPLSLGQVVACELLDAVRSGLGLVETARLDEALAAACEQAAADARPVETELLEPKKRRDRLSDCLRFVIRKGLARAGERRVLLLDRERILADEALARLEREYTSARDLVGEPA